MKKVNIKIWIVSYTDSKTVDRTERICFSEKTADETADVLAKVGFQVNIHEDVIIDAEVA